MKKVLVIVEDDNDSQELYRRTVHRYDPSIEVRGCLSTESALKTLQEIERQPDLAVVMMVDGNVPRHDNMYPPISTVTFVALVQSKYKNMPLIAASGDLKRTEELSKAGCRYCLGDKFRSPNFHSVLFEAFAKTGEVL